MNRINMTPRFANWLIVAALALAGVPATAGTLRVDMASAPAPGAALAGEYGFLVSNVGAGALDAVRVLADGGHAVQCAAATMQGRSFSLAGSLAASDSVRCVVRPSMQLRLRNASVVVLARGADGKATQRSFSLMQPAATPAQGIAVLAGGGIHNDSNTDGLLQAGETISYHYTLLNVGTLALSGLAVTDIDGAVTCPGSLAVGASATCTQVHTITVAEAGAGMVFNQVDLSGVDANATPVIAGDFVVTQNLGGDAGIRVFKSPLLFDDVDNSGYASPGDVLRYTFVIKNSNAQNLAAVNLTEPDPSRIDTPITCNPATLNGQPFTGLGSASLQSNDVELCSADYTVTAADASGGSADNLAEATAQPNIGPGVQGTAASAVVIPTAANVSVAKALSGESGSQPGIAEPGETLTYTITLHNSGAANAFNVGALDPLDPNVVFVSASNGGAPIGNTVTWSGLTVPGNGDLVLTVVVTVVDPIPLGTSRILNLAYVAGTTPPACVGNPLPPECISTPTEPAPRLNVTKVVSSPNVPPGGTATYTITVTNVGTVAASNVTIFDPLPPGLTAFQWTCAASGGATCANASGNGAINESIPSFPVGGQLVYIVTAQVDVAASGSILNSVRVTPSQNTYCMPQQTPGPCDASVPVRVIGPNATSKVPANSTWALLLTMLGLVGLVWSRRNPLTR